MSDCAELEIVLSRLGVGTYSLGYHFNPPGGNAETNLGLERPVTVSINVAELRALQIDSAAYGKRLAEMIFSDSTARIAFQRARSEAGKSALRLRFDIDPAATELHALAWETLVDPDRHDCLSASQKVYFSRYLRSDNSQSFIIPEVSRLRTLAVIASPSNVDENEVPPIDVAQHRALVNEALQNLDVNFLDGGGKATRDNLLDGLVGDNSETGGCEVLYLVAHGMLKSKDGSPAVLLEKPDGSVDLVPVDWLENMLRGLSSLPLLAVLVSCKSASGGENPLLTLGPRLIACGIPAVIAMNGDVSFESMRQFLPILLRELRRDGCIDRAVAAARWRVSGSFPDWWMPVLFSRLRDNQILKPLPLPRSEVTSRTRTDTGIPLSSPEPTQSFFWRAMIERIANGEAIPLVSASIGYQAAFQDLKVEETDLEPCYRLPPFEPNIINTLSYRWGKTDEVNYPFQDGYDLARVAQYTRSVNRSVDYTDINNNLVSFLKNSLLMYAEQKRTGPSEASTPRRTIPKRDLAEMAKSLGLLLPEPGHESPFSLLAALPFKVFITTSFHSFLEIALEDAGKHPCSQAYDWRGQPFGQKLKNTLDQGYTPDEMHPFVFHLYGSEHAASTMVLSEDDYLDFLIRASTDTSAGLPVIPSFLREALSTNSLILLGYRVQDWDFRILFRYLNPDARLLRGSNMVVQLDPRMRNQPVEIKKYREYLPSYFGKSFEVVWGDPEQVLRRVKNAYIDRGNNE